MYTHNDDGMAPLLECLSSAFDRLLSVCVSDDILQSKKTARVSNYSVDQRSNVKRKTSLADGLVHVLYHIHMKRSKPFDSFHSILISRF